MQLSAITRHVQDYQGIKPSQHGLVKIRSSLTNLMSFHDKLTSLVDKAKAVFYLDFSKIFDSISHSILLEKLAAHRLDGWTLEWLADWSQKVTVQGTQFSWWPVGSSVPQDSIVGQVLSVFMIWMRGSKAPSVNFQMTLS